MPQAYWNALVDRQLGFSGFDRELHARIRETSTVVIGAGGNGAVLDLLVRAGFMRFVIIDGDLVEGTNLNRLPFDQQSVGLPKTEVWKRHLLAINPECHIVTHTRYVKASHAAWLRETLQGVHLAFLGTTDVEANIVAGRLCAQAGIRMLVGPASSGSLIVSTFRHNDGMSVEKVAGFGTEGTPLEAIDYTALRERYAKALAFPGRKKNLEAQTWDAVMQGSMPARSCGFFVRLTNAAMAFEAVKNVAEMHKLPLGKAKLRAMPLVQIFDPWTGGAYVFDALSGQVGVPDPLSGALCWRMHQNTAQGTPVEGRADPRPLRKHEALHHAKQVLRYTGDRIKSLRVRLNISQEELAQLVKASPATVGAWEAGTKKPGGPTCTLLDILDRKGLDAFV